MYPYINTWQSGNEFHTRNHYLPQQYSRIYDAPLMHQLQKMVPVYPPTFPQHQPDGIYSTPTPSPTPATIPSHGPIHGPASIDTYKWISTHQWWVDFIRGQLATENDPRRRAELLESLNRHLAAISYLSALLR